LFILPLPINSIESLVDGNPFKEVSSDTSIDSRLRQVALSWSKEARSARETKVMAIAADPIKISERQGMEILRMMVSSRYRIFCNASRCQATVRLRAWRHANV
jgi:hypothetical protein